MIETERSKGFGRSEEAAILSDGLGIAGAPPKALRAPVAAVCDRRTLDLRNTRDSAVTDRRYSYGPSESRAEVSRAARDTAGEAPALPDSISPLTWLNLLCLDAPIVAISWHSLFAMTFGLEMAAPELASLFLTSWLIYLADRFGDSLRVNLRDPTSLRQRFCLRHRFAWLTVVAAVFVADVCVAWMMLDAETLRLGAQIGMLAVVYLFVNQMAPQLWRTLPLKEVSIGTLFAGGTMVGLTNDLPATAFAPWVLFACLCSLNCISIAIWEQRLDDAQQRTSIATAFPAIRHYLLAALGLLAGVSFAFAFGVKGGGAVSLCISASATALAALHIFRSRIQADSRTALTDLVLLTPLGVLLPSAFV